MQKIELLVFIHHLLSQSIRVERLTTKTEYRLSIHITALGNRPTRRITLSDKNTCIFLLVTLYIVQVETTIAQLTVVQVRFLSAFTSQLSHAGNGLTFLFRLLNLLQHHLCYLWILVQIVVDLGLDEITYKLVDTWTCRLVFLRHSRPHIVRAELGLGLALKHRFFHIEGNGCHDTITDIRKLLVLIIEFFDGTGNVLLQSTLMRTALCGMLPIDKGIVFLAILVSMGKGNLDVIALQVYYVIKAFGSHVILQKVFQTMARKDALTIVYKREPGVEICVISQQVLHELIQKLITDKQGVVRFEEDVSTIFFSRIFGHIADELTFLKRCTTYLSIAEACYLETATQRIHSLDTDTIQSNTLLESLGIIFTTCIQLTYRFDQLSLRDAAAIVTNAHPKFVLDVHFDSLSGSHLELVDTIVHHLFQEHIDTVIVLLAIAQTANVHPGTDTDMLHIIQVTNVVFVIFYGIFYQFFFHGIC